MDEAGMDEAGIATTAFSSPTLNPCHPSPQAENPLLSLSFARTRMSDTGCPIHRVIVFRDEWDIERSETAFLSPATFIAGELHQSSCKLNTHSCRTSPA
jgi:hypothetical protein